MKVKKIQTAAFAGHRQLPKDITPLAAATRDAVVGLIKRGVICFGGGGAFGFDTLAAKVVLELRDTVYPQIRLIQVLPFRGMDSGWTQEQKDEFDEINSRADNIIWLTEEYTGDELYRIKNRNLVDRSAHLIAYCTDINGNSGAAACYRDAVKKEINIILLNERL